jgi:hypothetical protein
MRLEADVVDVAVMVADGGLAIIVEWWQWHLVVIIVVIPPLSGFPLPFLPLSPIPLSLCCLLHSFIPYPPCEQLLTAVVGCVVGPCLFPCLSASSLSLPFH